jgi:uncharacterized cupredoxin-like copper-binding protein
LLIRKPTLLVLGATIAALAFAGCGGGGGGSSSTSSAPAASGSTGAAGATGSTSSGGGAAATSSLSLAADPGGALKFDKSSLSAKAGTVTITMDNPSSVPHGVAVKGNGANKVGQIVQKGGKSTISVTLKSGKYEFYCPVPGHEQAGMKGTLTVQ